MPPAITASDLGKRYRIGTSIAPYGTLREAIAGVARRRAAVRAGEIWALRNVGFEVRHGEIVGIIGRNGAGKSTLLKILSRITHPTTGAVDLYGRVGSLLEVGTGFHPELTGRENVFLNGAILGMRRRDIARRFDEIVAFAEVETFIDTPVKRYSSGMYLRLAFAVAAHLHPDILVVDEVLAVGDSVFQRKCLGRMKDVAGEGRTVIFVSHDLAAVSRLCGRVLLLDKGRLVREGSAAEVVSEYLRATMRPCLSVRWPDAEAPGDEFIRALSVEIRPADPAHGEVLHQDRDIVIAVTYRILRSMRAAHVGFILNSGNGGPVLTTYDVDSAAGARDERVVGDHTSSCSVPAGFLNEGRYSLTVLAGIPFTTLCFRLDDVIGFDVQPPIDAGDLWVRTGPTRPGAVVPDFRWNMVALGASDPARER